MKLIKGGAPRRRQPWPAWSLDDTPLPMLGSVPNAFGAGRDSLPRHSAWAAIQFILNVTRLTESVADRVTFEVAMSKSFPGKDYDLVAFFDCLHDMGDPVGASAHVCESLKPDAAWMIVEPFATDNCTTT